MYDEWIRNETHSIRLHAPYLETRLVLCNGVENYYNVIEINLLSISLRSTIYKNDNKNDEYDTGCCETT